ncbi:chitin-binding type-4 domain-containing protein [Caerostris extrusa]|uniref:Chitin-binding type-4 domain-containing protein n=1 Tax=Caerostris extrusa TaxID=172846 RepID=A0AAV4XA78_CAEEX|nr:chitin-binding type-4 domain-containing protein [Caerostris extrusa]
MWSMWRQIRFTPTQTTRIRRKLYFWVIGRTYQPGRLLDVVVEIVANHKGYFEFSICERNDPNVRETEECFDKRLLQLADGTGDEISHSPRR